MLHLFKSKQIKDAHMKSKIKDSNKTADPAAMYQAKSKIAIYKDIEDMDKSRLGYNTQTDVLTRIKNTVELIKRVFRYDIMDKTLISKKLYFK